MIRANAFIFSPSWLVNLHYFHWYVSWKLFMHKYSNESRQAVSSLFYFIFFNVYLFLRDRARVGERQRERKTQNSKQLQALSCQHRAWRGAWTRERWDHDLSRSRTLSPSTSWAPRHPKQYRLQITVLCLCLYAMNAQWSFCINKGPLFLKSHGLTKLEFVMFYALRP